jgi:Protein of unknown function (DUF565)
MLFKIISFFFGFLLASIADTTIAEFQEWSILGAALLITSVEATSQIYYTVFRQKKIYSIKALPLINNLKLGLIYGLIVEAFKLGS